MPVCFLIHSNSLIYFTQHVVQLVHACGLPTHHVHVGDGCRGRSEITLMRNTDLLQVALLDTLKQMLQNKGEVNYIPSTLSPIAHLPLGMKDEAPPNQLWQHVSYHSYQQRVHAFQEGPPLKRTALPWCH